MCQHGSEGDIADTPDVLRRGGELVIDDNATLVI